MHAMKEATEILEGVRAVRTHRIRFRMLPLRVRVTGRVRVRRIR